MSVNYDDNDVYMYVKIETQENINGRRVACAKKMFIYNVINLK